MQNLKTHNVFALDQDSKNLENNVKKDLLKADYTRDKKLTDFGKATLLDRYLLPGEKFQDMFLRVSKFYADDKEHARRIYNYISNLWFMPATPVLSNGGA